MPFFYDATYILVLIGAGLCLLASARVNSTFAKFNRVRSMSGMCGAEAAQRVLAYAGIYDVQIRRVGGTLTDHYDPRTKTLNLSDSVYGSYSVAAIGVAAHECGHAIQHAQRYAPLSFRSALVFPANIGSRLGLPILIIGALFTRGSVLIPIGLILFSFGVLFQLVTLPVEFDASDRALVILQNSGMMHVSEVNQAEKVLKAAALTYVASAAASILQLLRLILIFGGGRRRD